MNPTAFQILKLLMRYETLAPKDMAELTGVSHTYLHRTLKQLHERKLIVYDEPSGSHRTLNSNNPFIIKLREFLAAEEENSQRIDMLSKRNIRKITQCFLSDKIVSRKIIGQATFLSNLTIAGVLKKLIEEHIVQLEGRSNRPHKYRFIDSARNRLFLELCDFLENESWKKEKRVGYEQLRQMLLNNNKVHVLVPYGSSSFGMDDNKSDIDLFVVVSDRQTLKEIKSIKHDSKIELNILLIENLPSLSKKQPQFISQLLHSSFLKGRNVLESVYERQNEYQNL